MFDKQDVINKTNTFIELSFEPHTVLHFKIERSIEYILKLK